MDATNDADLIAAYLAGDHNAFTKIYKRHSPSLRRTARLKLYDKHACDDILQDVFLIVAKKLHNIDDPERLSQWLQQILVREVYRYNTKGLRSVATDFQSDSPSDQADIRDPYSEGALVAYEELKGLLKSAAEGLGERDRMILSLLVDHGVEGNDLASDLEVLPKDLHSLLHRMRDQLEKCFDAYCVAQVGRRSCPELAEILFRWSGRLDVQIRKRIVYHIEVCPICQTVRTQQRIAIADLRARPSAPPRR